MYQVQPQESPAPTPASTPAPAHAPAPDDRPSATTTEKHAPVGSHDNPRPGQIFDDWAAF